MINTDFSAVPHVKAEQLFVFTEKTSGLGLRNATQVMAWRFILNYLTSQFIVNFSYLFLFSKPSIKKKINILSNFLIIRHLNTLANLPLSDMQWKWVAGWHLTWFSQACALLHALLFGCPPFSEHCLLPDSFNLSHFKVGKWYWSVHLCWGSHVLVFFQMHALCFLWVSCL